MRFIFANRNNMTAINCTSLRKAIKLAESLDAGDLKSATNYINDAKVDKSYTVLDNRVYDNDGEFITLLT
jgi:hypothetical protein